MLEPEQRVPRSEFCVKIRELVHLIDFLFDLPSRSTMLTSIATVLTSVPAIAATTHGEKRNRKGKVIFRVQTR